MKVIDLNREVLKFHFPLKIYPLSCSWIFSFIFGSQLVGPCVMQLRATSKLTII